jgi:hypothetical protein
VRTSARSCREQLTLPSVCLRRVAIACGICLLCLWPPLTPRDLLGTPLAGAQAPETRPWTLWYEGEGEAGEDCDDAGGAALDSRDCPQGASPDVLVRGPAYATRDACEAAERTLTERIPEMVAGDHACLRTGKRPGSSTVDRR